MKFSTWPSAISTLLDNMREVVCGVLLTTAKDRPSSHLLQSKEACPRDRQYPVSAESEISALCSCTLVFGTQAKVLSFQVKFLLVIGLLVFGEEIKP